MSKPLGPGDRAILVKAINPQNLHRVVSVVATIRRGEMAPWNGTHGLPAGPAEWDGFVVESLGSPFFIKSRGIFSGYRSMLAVVRPDWLKRLDDDFDDDQVESERETWHALEKAFGNL